jgi:hypothetical protein
MTVGIAATCRKDDEPRVVVAADRMVTFGQQGGIEHEDPSSKVAVLQSGGPVTAVAVGSGRSTYLDEILNRTESLLSNPDNQIPTTVTGVRDYALVAYKETVRDTIDNQVMAPLGYSLSDLKDDDVEVPAEIQKTVSERAYKIRDQAAKGARILVAGVGTDGPGIYTLSGMDFTNHTDMGYTTIGSGTESARLTFIRRHYDEYAEHREGVFTVLEAKEQAEERQGVGRDTDLLSVSRESVKEYDPDEMETLRQKLTKIDAEEREARQSVMDQWENNHT